MKLIIILLIVFSMGHMVTPFILSAMSNIETVVSFVDLVKNMFSPEKTTPSPTEKKLDVVFGKIEEVSEKLDKMAESIDNKLDGITESLNRMEHMAKVIKAQDELAGHINRIDELYDEFIAYTDNPDKFQKKTIDEFINVITSHDNLALGNTLNRMHALFVPKRAKGIRGSILNLVLGIQNVDSEFTCDNPQSIQQHMLLLYELVVVSELKGFAIINFAYATLTTFDNVPYTTEHEKSTAQALLRSMEYLNNTKAAMMVASRRYSRCDPDQWESDEDYFELQHLFQGFLIGEDQAGVKNCKDIDTLHFKSCHQYETKKKELRVYGPGVSHLVDVWTATDFCLKQKCQANVQNCITVGAEPEICEMEDRNPIRYEYIKNSEVTWGKNEDCSSGTVTKVKTVTEKGHNKMCLCECTESQDTPNATRPFSLDPVLSDVENNMVITGLRISNKDHMVRFEIEQGKLLEYGSVDDDSVDWVPSVEYKWESYYSRIMESEIGDWNAVGSDGKKKPLVQNQNYTYFWAKQKTLNLDNVYAPKDYVMTGVKFVHDDNSKTKKDAGSGLNRNPLQVAIQITPIDFIKGKLTPTAKNPSKWITPKEVKNKDKEYKKKRTEVKLIGVTDPLKSTSTNKRDSTPNQFINFQMSDLKTDVGTYTVPFIDIQEVSPVQKSPLDGIGIFHKGFKKYGGFVAFQVFHMDYSHYLEAGLTPERLKDYEKRALAENSIKTSRQRSHG